MPRQESLFLTDRITAVTVADNLTTWIDFSLLTRLVALEHPFRAAVDVWLSLMIV